MIKHHPKDELLNVFVDGELPASLSAAIAIHAEMCPACQKKIAKLTESQAKDVFENTTFELANKDSESFEVSHLHKFIINDAAEQDEIAEIDFDDMLDAIVADDSIDMSPLTAQQQSYDKTISIGDITYTLPRAIRNINLGRFTKLGKLSRARFELNEGEIHTSLLHIQPGGGVPEHTHKGYELTLLLSGEFSDEMGEYVPGDFIMLDAKNTHQPITAKGCLCFTVANDSLHFTQGINRLLNPIGSFIY